MNTTERHLTDAELLQLLDGGEGHAHAEDCEQCADALATLQADSTVVTDWLERAAFEAPGPEHYGLDPAALRTAGGDTRTDGPVGSEPKATTFPADATAPEVPADAAAVRSIGSRTHRAPRPTAGSGAATFLKAAAVVLLVAAPLAAFPGVRAWVGQVVDRIAPTEETAVTSAEPEAVILRFTPTPGDFVVVFPAGATGTLALERADGDEAELRAVGGEPETVVTASSLEIRNADAGRYELRLPAAVAGVWVRVGERAVAVTGTQIERGTVVELGR